MHLRRRIPLVALMLALFGLTLGAAPNRIKLATLAPDGSPWHRELEAMGAEVGRATDGRVEIVLYPGGVAGDDRDMIRKMRIGQLQAAALTVIGLADLDPAFNVFTTPLYFDSFEEMVHVRDGLTPAMRKRLEAEGWVLVNWGHGGWLRFFSREPVHTVDDLKKLKIFTSAGDPAMIAIYKESGFRPVPLSPTDILTGLQTGMIDGLPTTPLAALALQWFRQAPYMLDVPIAPLIGATVMPLRAWNGLSAADREALLHAGAAMQQRLDEVIPGRDRAAIDEMTQRGLHVVPRATGAEGQRWEETARAFARLQSSVPAEIVEQAKTLRDEFRKEATKSGP